METVAIIGTGRMGGLLAQKLNGNYKLILIDKNIRRCGLLSEDLGVIATHEYSLMTKADYIIAALPSAAIPKAILEMHKYLLKEHILINISTDTPMQIFEDLQLGCKLVSAKIIGNARQISQGEMPIILIDGDDEQVTKRVAEVFSRVGPIGFGPEKLVKTINNIASEEGIRAAFIIQKRLRELKIPEEYICAAIRNVASGTMSSYALGDVGPFAQKILNELIKEQSHS